MPWAIISIIFGLVVGSFLNVVINRLRLGKTLGGRSECPHCHHELQAKDLVPVFSFLLLGGRCAYCGKSISWQYPMVELATAFSFFLIQARYPAPGVDVFFLWVLAAFLIVIAVYDLKHFLILDKVVFPGLLVALGYNLVADFSSGCAIGLQCATISGLLGAAIISGFFGLQYWISRKKWIGFGDVKLGLFLGMAVGFPLCIFLLFTAYTAGAIVGVGLIAAGKKDMGSKLPFGTFLAIATIVTFIYGEPILQSYLELIGFPTLL